MSKPIERIAALAVGTVESVSPSGIQVILEPNAPQTTALNTGVPTGFPRINGYVLIPNESGAIVGLVVWLGVERSQFPKRTGLKDFGLVDLPFPLRKVSLTPLGTLMPGDRSSDGEVTYHLHRGVCAFPSVGDTVQLPTAAQLRGIVEASKQEDRRVAIGTSPLAGNIDVTVDPDKMFGRHLAVLGNTGSGKSCTVAGLIQWSMDCAKKAKSDVIPNARFIILDPNGEYASAFADDSTVRLFQVSPTEAGVRALTCPAWMWNSHEWCAFTEASSRVQKPILLRALRELRAEGGLGAADSDASAVFRLRMLCRSIIKDKHQGPTAYMDFPGKQNFGQKLKAVVESVEHLAQSCNVHRDTITDLSAALKSVMGGRPPDGRGYYPPFSDADLDRAIDAFEDAIGKLPSKSIHMGVGEDTPVPFDVADLVAAIEQAADDEGQSQFIDTLVLRVKMLLSNERLIPVVSSAVGDLASWLDEVIGSESTATGCIAILDLSLLPSDVTHTVTSVLARLVFEATQRYRRLFSCDMPTVLVLEEAHTFVKRGTDDGTDIPTPAQVCRQTFERIAREGRKFGLGLVLSSQRPSELSPTVLAQCNTFILHRIVNDKDQELVGKLVPDNLGGLLGELPSLPSRQAILLGWAAAVPVLVEINELPEHHRPRSSDPKFWDVWTGKEERKIDWKAIVDDWTGVREEPPTEPELATTEQAEQ
jgi:hypothetical protein